MNNNRGTTFLLGAAASGWMICDMAAATATAAQSQTLALVKYFLLAVMVVTTLYPGAKWLTMK